MTPTELARWQWNGYSRNHVSRANLWLHIVFVPLFLIGNVALLFALWRGSLGLSLAAVGLMVISLAVQGRGHRGEQQAPEPFTSKRNAVARLLLEQWFTFPRFVLSGGWWRALRSSSNA